MKLLFIRHGDPDYEKDYLTEKGFREATGLKGKFIFVARLWGIPPTCIRVVNPSLMLVFFKKPMSNQSNSIFYCTYSNTR